MKRYKLLKQAINKHRFCFIDYQNMDIIEKEIRADERSKTIDEVIKILSKSEDTILTDKQYYEVLKLKGGAENGEE